MIKTGDPLQQADPKNFDAAKKPTLRVPVARLKHLEGEIVGVAEYEKNHAWEKIRTKIFCPGCNEEISFVRAHVKNRRNRPHQVTAHFAHRNKEHKCESIEHIVAKAVLREDLKIETRLPWWCDQCKWGHKIEYTVIDITEEQRIQTQKAYPRYADLLCEGIIDNSKEVIHLAIEVTVSHKTSHTKWDEYKGEDIFGIEYVVTRKLSQNRNQKTWTLEDWDTAKKEMRQMLKSIKPKVKSKPTLHCPKREKCENCGQNKDIRNEIAKLQCPCGKTHWRMLRRWGKRNPQVSLKPTEIPKPIQAGLAAESLLGEHRLPEIKKDEWKCQCGKNLYNTNFEFLKPKIEANEEPGCETCSATPRRTTGEWFQQFSEELPPYTKNRIIAYAEKNRKIDLLLRSSNLEADTILTHAAETAGLELCQKIRISEEINQPTQDELEKFKSLQETGVAGRIYLEEGWEFKKTHPKLYHHQTCETTEVLVLLNKDYEIEVNGKKTQWDRIYQECRRETSRQGGARTSIVTEPRLEKELSSLASKRLQIGRVKTPSPEPIEIFRGRDGKLKFLPPRGFEAPLEELQSEIIRRGLGYIQIELSVGEKDPDQEWVTRGYQNLWDPKKVVVCSSARKTRPPYRTIAVIEKNISIKIDDQSWDVETAEEAKILILTHSTETLEVKYEVDKSGSNKIFEDLVFLLADKIKLIVNRSTQALERQQAEEKLLEEEETLRKIREGQLSIQRATIAANQKRNLSRVRNYIGTTVENGSVQRTINNYTYSADQACIPSCKNKTGICSLEDTCQKLPLMKEVAKNNQKRGNPRKTVEWKNGFPF